MSHVTLKLIPGVDTEKTPALNEAALSQTQLVRFFPDRSGLGLVQKLGGWTRFFASQMVATVKALLAWEDTNAATHLAFGTSYRTSNLQAQLGVITSNNLVDITPRTLVDNVAVDVSISSGDSTLTIVDPENSISSYDSVFISTHIAAGGLIFFGLYSTANVSATSYTIDAVDILGNPLVATGTTTNAGSVAEFTTTSGSSVVTVTLTAHGLYAGATYPVLVSTTVGGITIYGNYDVIGITDANNFTIQAQQQATSGTTGFINGDNSQYIYYIGAGSNPSGTGYGTGGYGSGGYGGTVAPVTAALGVPIPATDWTLDNFGQILVACADNNLNNTIVTNWASGNGTTATIGLGTPFLISPGSAITVSGVAPAGYNGAATVTGWVPTSFSASGGTATVAFNSTYVTPVGSTVVLYGTNPSGYSGTYTITASSAGHVSFLSAGTGSLITAGTMYSNSAVAFANATTGSQTVVGSVFVPNLPYGPLYYWDPTSGAPFAYIVPNSPIVNDGFFVAMPQRQVICWGSTATGIQDPLLLRWCDLQDFTDWTALPTNQAGQWRISKGSKIVTGIQGPQQGLIWTDLAIWSMQYIGPPYVYGFNELANGCGAIGRHAAGSMNGIVYWMSQSQFFMMGPAGIGPILCPVWDQIFQQLDTANVNNIRFAANARFGEVQWFYPIIGGNGQPTNYVKYNTYTQQWDYGVLGRTAWIDQSVLGPPIGTSTTTNYIYQHETSNDADGMAMSWYFQTGYFVLGDAEWKMFVDQVWPDMKWGQTGGMQSATVMLYFYVVDYPGDTPAVYGPYNLTQATQYITPRFRGRLCSIWLGGNDIGSFARIGAMRYRVAPDGKF